MNVLVLIALRSLVVFFSMYLVAAWITRDRFEDRIWVAIMGLSGLLGMIVSVLILAGCAFWSVVGGQ